MPIRHDLRNVAIIAHVDHGKTTLVDAMLRQAGTFAARAESIDRVLDSMDLEREKGITILAKQASIRWDGIKINIIDTPGHADFGGEVERGLAMVDGAMLLVDAAEGPRPQTRFVLRKALESGMPVIPVVNKLDRPDARVAEVVDEVLELLFDLGAGDAQLDLPFVFGSSRQGWMSLEPHADRESEQHRGADHPDDERDHEVKRGLDPLFRVLFAHLPPPTFAGSGYCPEGTQAEAGAAQPPLQALVTNLASSPYLGRLAICRVLEGTMQRGQLLSWCRRDGSVERAKATELLVVEGLDRVPIGEVGPGEIVAVAGMADITVGETLSDPDDPRPLPLLHVDEPSIAMTIGVNSSPLAGHDGTKLTARLLASRLAEEVVGNVSIRVLPTERSDAFEVQGRGELALAILVELMRREGFELTVGKPEVLLREIDGVLHEPIERLSVDVPEDHFGALSQILSQRKARLEEMVNHGTGWIRLEYLVPARGLIGIRTEVLTETRGTAQLHHVFEGYDRWQGEIRTRNAGSLVADRAGVTTTYALMALGERGVLFVSPGEQVYEGMVIGENNRPEDMDVNPTKERKQTNMRSSTAEELVRLQPPRRLGLEQALEQADETECVEVTPAAVRLRKVVLDRAERGRRQKRDRTPARAGT